MNEYEAAGTFYRPGDWSLPLWWTEGTSGRNGRLTRAEQEVFYNGWFCRKVLGHTGGLTRHPLDLSVTADKGEP